MILFGVGMFQVCESLTISERVLSTDNMLEVNGSSICVSPSCIKLSHMLNQNMDLASDPCEDFYQFTCGKYLERTVIPEDKGSYGAFAEARDILEKDARQLMEGNATAEWAVFDKARDFYRSCMDEEKIEEDGFAEVRSILKELGGMPLLEGEGWDSGEGGWRWMETVAALAKRGLVYGSIIGVKVNEDEKFNVHLTDPSLGINRKYLVKGREDKVVKAYFNFMVDMASLLGAESEEAVETQVEEMLQLEMELAEASR